MSKKKEIVKLVIEQLLTCNAKIAEALEVLYEDDEILNNQESVLSNWAKSDNIKD